ncbi:MAG: aldo/keto reductase [Planctomycetaceae bacterium]|nr:aldo/keto reductase [Planctomycetaceae bacterium]
MKHGIARRDVLKLIAAGAAGAGLAGLDSAAVAFASSAGKMPKRSLGKTGVEVSILALGGQSALTDFADDEMAGRFVNDCIDAGITYLDTAPMYGRQDDPRNSERRFGKAIGRRRKDVYLATKTLERDADKAMRDIETSLKLLQTDHLDCLQIHSITAAEDLARLGKPDGIYTLVRKLRDQKVIRFIGVTGHCGAERMKQAVEMYEFDTLLATFNPTKNGLACEETLLPAAQKQKLGIIAMKVMGGTPQYSRKGTQGLPGLLVGGEAGKTSPENLLRYALSLPIHVVVNGIYDRKQLQQNTAVCYDFQPMKDSQRRELQKSLRDSDLHLSYLRPEHVFA